MATLASLTVKVLGDTSGFITSMDKAQRRSKSFNDGLRKSRAPLLALTGATLGLGFGAIKAFGDFDGAMTKSLAIMGDVSDTMRTDMVTAAEAVGKTTTFSATEAAESFFFLASAGLDATASIKALPAVASFAQAGMFDMALATDLLTDAQSALGLTIRDDAVANMENMVRVSDILVKANTLANASVQQFSESLTNKAGAALRMVGKDLEEGVAVLAAFADQGVKGSEAGTQFGIVLRDLQTKAIQNSKEFDTMGVAVFDSTGEMNNMADILADLEGLMAGMSDETKKATLLQLGFSDKSVAALQTLIGLSDQISIYEDGLRDAGGVTQMVADKQLEAFNAQMKIATDKIVIVASKLGAKLAPAVLDILGKVETLVDWFEKLDDKTIGVIIGVVGVTGALAALGLIIPPITTGLGLMAGVFTLMGIATVPASGGVWATVGAFIALNAVTGGIILAVGALISVIILMALNWDKTKEIIQTGATAIMGFFETMVNFVISKINFLIDAFNQFSSIVGYKIERIATVSFGKMDTAIEETENKFRNFTIGAGDEFEEMGRDWGDTLDTMGDDTTDFVEETTSSFQTMADRMTGFKEQRLESEADMVAKLKFMGAEMFTGMEQGQSDSLASWVEMNELKLRAFEIYQAGFMTIDEAIMMAEIEHMDTVEALRQKNLEKQIEDLEAMNKLKKDIADQEFADLRKAVGLLPDVIRSNINQGVPSFGGESDLLKGAGSNVFFDELGRMFGINQKGEAVLLGDYTQRAEPTEAQRRSGQPGDPLESFGDESEAGKAARAEMLVYANELIRKMAEQKPVINIHTPAVIGDNADEVIAAGYNRANRRGMIEHSELI